MRRALTLAGLVVGAALLLAAAGSPRGIKEGGAFRIGMATGSVTTIDPALGVQLLAPACGSLMDYPAKPELAEADPMISGAGTVYTFTVRKDARFSDGSRVTARAFARAIERILDPAMQGYAASDLAAALVGGEDVVAGRTKKPSGVSARGRVLTLRLTKRIPDFLSSVEQLCAVPPSLPADPEGAKAPLSSPAPYYVAQYVPGERLVLERNRFYRGQRPHHVDRFVADLHLDAGSIIDSIASGEFDFSSTINIGERASELRQRYGVNKSQLFVRPASELRMFVLNTRGPLFKNNPNLRQAVNFAVDRKALTRELGPLAGTPTDKYLSPSQAGYRDERLYPLKGADLRRARALAKGHTRSGKAILYTTVRPEDVAQAQVLRQNLAAIGLEVEITQFPRPLLFEKLADGGNGFDIGRVAWVHSPDPSWFAGIFDGRTIGQAGSQNWSYFDSRTYNRLFAEASRLTGNERYRAYGKLDLQLSREAAPAIPIANLNAIAFVSARVGCVVMNPNLDLTAVCLK